jgi:hypothetical protein
MKITRIWAMPNKETFTIKPIKELLNHYIHPNNWCDPFSGNNSPAMWTNDLNPKTSAKCHLSAEEFIKKLPHNVDGVLWDPPYSLRQLKECYENIDKEMTFAESQDATFSKLKTIIAPKINPGGTAISFGWSSMGFGKDRGFEIIEILLVPHGGHHNDTIVTVERKVQNQIKADK